MTSEVMRCGPIIRCFTRITSGTHDRRMAITSYFPSWKSRLSPSILAFSIISFAFYNDRFLTEPGIKSGWKRSVRSDIHKRTERQTASEQKETCRSFGSFFILVLSLPLNHPLSPSGSVSKRPARGRPDRMERMKRRDKGGYCHPSSAVQIRFFPP